ncbi:heavy-metal-associated domain-containing protein [Nonomuraea gerenzanensis]|uniref:Copper chaperone n=1 Tax=Nonomuraea gerenzanensis TaxID=93944 RepID=A0A1M4E5V8_9ACTN|nr:heavy metal-associated domain-containing protein [Nonomuraea gerenzanensis]UBU16408.1 heavy-metal-associated domain-containing protein [Nonomuraea gerenzanensis]SBO94229.1 Copper chaperone [Nonomuraea gerenzanensis]
MITVAYSLVAYRITGLSPETCDHCLAAIKSELIQVPGVVGVEVDPAAGRVSVLTDGPVGEEQVRVAVEAAGCAVADS